MEGRYVLALEAQIHVAVVFKHRNAVSSGDFQDLLTPLQGHGPAQGVLESGNGVEVLDPLAEVQLFSQGSFQRIGDNALLVALDAHDVGIVAAHLAQGADVEELLGQHHVAGVGQRLDEHGDGFAGTRRKHHVVGAHLHVAVPGQLVGHQLAQRRQPGGVGIICQFVPLPLQGVFQPLGQAGQGQGVRVRVGHGKVVPGAGEGAACPNLGALGEKGLVVETFTCQSYTCGWIESGMNGRR